MDLAETILDIVFVIILGATALRVIRALRERDERQHELATERDQLVLSIMEAQKLALNASVDMLRAADRAVR